MDLQIVDGLAWVRERPEQFFPSGQPDAMWLVAYVMSDVLELGRGECRISSRAGWWWVASDADWMRHPVHSPQELFQRVVPAPGQGMHSLRSEVLLNAFASDVFIWSPGTSTRIKGEAPGRELVDSAVDPRWCERSVAFRLSTGA